MVILPFQRLTVAFNSFPLSLQVSMTEGNEFNAPLSLSGVWLSLWRYRALEMVWRRKPIKIWTKNSLFAQKSFQSMITIQVVYKPIKIPSVNKLLENNVEAKRVCDLIKTKVHRMSTLTVMGV